MGKSKIALKCSEGNTGTSEQKRHPNWVITIFGNEPTFNESKMKYLLYAPEVCPTTGKKHWQTFVSWKVGHFKTLTATAKWFNKSHTEIAKGDVEHQLNYIRGPFDDGNGKTKPFNPDWKEFGVRPQQGARTDLQALVDNVMSGETTPDDICIENPIMYHQYGRTLQKAEDLRMRKIYRTEKTTCLWVYGPTGVGKSHLAFKDYSPDTHYVCKLNDNGWWDGYKQQETVIINEFRGQIKYSELLEMIDKYPFDVPRRGREPIPFVTKHIIITSCKSPEQVYCNLTASDSIDQLLKRIEVLEL